MLHPFLCRSCQLIVWLSAQWNHNWINGCSFVWASFLAPFLSSIEAKALSESNHRIEHFKLKRRQSRREGFPFCRGKQAKRRIFMEVTSSNLVENEVTQRKYVMENLLKKNEQKRERESFRAIHVWKFTYLINRFLAKYADALFAEAC